MSLLLPPHRGVLEAMQDEQALRGVTVQGQERNPKSQQNFPSASAAPHHSTDEFAATADLKLHDLSKKQAADMAAFLGKVSSKDGSLLADLSRDFRMYTVNTLLYVPYTADKEFACELKYDAYLSNLKRFDACAAIMKAREDISEDRNIWDARPKPSWPKDIAEYLGDFVPAERLLEVVSLLERQFTVFDLVAMCDEDILQIVIMLEKKLSFKKKYLFRYLQAAQYIHTWSPNHSEEEKEFVNSAYCKRLADQEVRKALAKKLATLEIMGSFWWKLVGSSRDPAPHGPVTEFYRQKYLKLPWLSYRSELVPR